MGFLINSTPSGSFLGRIDWLHVYIAGAAIAVGAFVVLILLLASRQTRKVDFNSGVFTYVKFIYASFLKPHEKNGNGQQDALESFYKTQASVYDATRRRLLRGREDMLGLVAAQLKHKVDSQELKAGEAIWVDIGGGTGYNIEAMSAFLSVPDFFAHVYLVDLSPSLCDVARQRFERLGWKNVSVVCQDARSFRLPEEDKVDPRCKTATVAGADLATMSYSLSMIPDYYSVIDSLPALIKPSGVLGVCDFYVQSIVDVSSRNYIGGAFNRHVNWLGRAFWRAWFDADRVSLEAARRDYLEYRFGTVISASERNYLLGGIPYYIFVGCQKDSTTHSGREAIEKLNASFTESPYLSPAKHRSEMDAAIVSSTQEIKSKAYESAVINLGSNLPLPSSFYQNHHYRIFYNDLLPKHTQFGHEYIYAFNWEDPRVDHKLLDIQRDDVILAITSAGDNILDYLQKSPRRVHAVDLNPNQNHLLELKVASFIALGYRDVWKIFGEGKHSDFRRLLIEKLSPHLSSQAFQYWLEHTQIFTSSSGKGLYETGGSRHAIKMIRYLFQVFGLQGQVAKLCEAQTLAEQRKIWPKIRAVLMSKPLHWAVVGTEWFAWKAAGVPRNQRNIIIDDFYKRNGLNKEMKQAKDISGQSIWEYVVDTLDPVVQDTLISNDNYFYFLCLQGQFSRRCHPAYLTPKSHVKLSSPGAFDGLRIHTDEINEVIKRITPKSLTIAVIMDSMDWFDATSDAASAQAQKLNQALKKGGRILLRSASIEPWYIRHFEANGFTARRVGARYPGTCIDRVNMYASTWICTKTRDLDRPTPSRAMSALSLNE
ncbi:class I SAM-dependent methyltransferase [Aspergillus saccharolyticus JOP 1030-1]|uniref:Sialidase n=1 Tax=Aspergillus saccharolyticus JOP 1030-1 TaxID=1450539 RepID=A0A318ZL43_9EURO|nr:sialidase [Aspergillus saccharolyticus JOP 1030-1]PYH47485.1 sialidase [Aspergillus saccharolyticus JOP 1030-1]